MTKKSAQKRPGKIVMIFGTFDGIHDGHRNFLAQAKALGNYLIAVVTPNSVVRALKRRLPRIKLAGRIDILEREMIADAVIAGDEAAGSWEVIKTYRPDVIALGYDQKNLRAVLGRDRKQFGAVPRIVVLNPHQPDVLHSSILFKNRAGSVSGAASAKIFCEKSSAQQAKRKVRPVHKKRSGIETKKEKKNFHKTQATETE